MAIDVSGTWKLHNRSDDVPWEKLGVPLGTGSNLEYEIKFSPYTDAKVERPQLVLPPDLPLSWSPPWSWGRPLRYTVPPPPPSPDYPAFGNLWAHLLPATPGTANQVLHMIRTHYPLQGTTPQQQEFLRMYYVGYLQDPQERLPGSTVSFFGHVVNNTVDERIQTFRLYR